MSRGFGLAARVTAIFSVRAVRSFLSLLLWVLLFFTIFLIFLEFPHPAVFDAWTPAVLLKKGAAFLLAPIDHFLGWRNAVMFYLLAFAFFFSILLIVFDSNLRWVRRRLEGKSK